MLECVVNVSEGRDERLLAGISDAADSLLLDVHRDPHHNRSVLTLGGEKADVETAARAVMTKAVDVLDIRNHDGCHPRMGVVDVVPFVPIEGSTMDDAVAARARFLEWVATLGVPGFSYGPAFGIGPERSLPEVRKAAFVSLAPDTGPPTPHPTAGAVCVGARPVLVAFNVWLADGLGADTARRVATEVRSPALRALGFDVGGRAQVSMNLVDPLTVGPMAAFDAVAELVDVAGAELVGLVPQAVLRAVPECRWVDLDLAADKTIEYRTSDTWRHRTGRGRPMSPRSLRSSPTP